MLGAFCTKDFCSVLEPGDHGSTFGGNPLTTAAAYASAKYIVDNDVASNAKNMGARLLQCLQELKSRHSIISDVRGKGLLAAVEFTDDIGAKAISSCNDAVSYTHLTLPPILLV